MSPYRQCSGKKEIVQPVHDEPSPLETEFTPPSDHQVQKVRLMVKFGKTDNGGFEVKSVEHQHVVPVGNSSEPNLSHDELRQQVRITRVSVLYMLTNIDGECAPSTHPSGQ